MTEQQPIPTNWVCKADLIHCRPDLEERIAALDDGDIEYFAGKIGDALQETYWLAMEIMLAEFFETETDSDAQT